MTTTRQQEVAPDARRNSRHIRDDKRGARLRLPQVLTVGAWPVGVPRVGLSTTGREVTIMRCSHCHGGLMLPDSHDPADVRTCATCGRSTFTPSAEVLADVQRGRPTSSEIHIHGRGRAVQGKGRELGIPRGYVSPAVRRFA